MLKKNRRTFQWHLGRVKFIDVGELQCLEEGKWSARNRIRKFAGASSLKKELKHGAPGIVRN